MSVNTSKYYQSLSLEFKSLQDRVRYLIEDKHWLTDGEHKESVLRAVLKRHIPNTVAVGRGFVVQSHGCSKQIDVLLRDTSKPVLYQDGDLVIVTPDSIKGIIEVKTKIDFMREFEEIIEKMAKNSESIFNNYQETEREHEIFLGLFAYESNFNENHSEQILNSLKAVARSNQIRVINYICLGKSLFVRFWENRPNLDFRNNYNSWHFYHLKNQSYGYFINNCVASVATDSISQNQDIWFPREGKESNLIREISLLD